MKNKFFLSLIGNETIDGLEKKSNFLTKDMEGQRAWLIYDNQMFQLAACSTVELIFFCSLKDQYWY